MQLGSSKILKKSIKFGLLSFEVPSSRPAGGKMKSFGNFISCFVIIFYNSKDVLNQNMLCEEIFYIFK